MFNRKKIEELEKAVKVLESRVYFLSGYHENLSCSYSDLNKKYKRLLETLGYEEVHTKAHTSLVKKEQNNV